MYSLATAVDNTVLCIWKMLREQALKHLIKEKTPNYVKWWMLTKFTVIIILKYIPYISNHPKTDTMLYVNHVSMKLK